MLDKLKYIFSFNWFYIFLIGLLLMYNFSDEIIIGKETIEIISNKKELHEPIKQEKVKLKLLDINKLPIENNDMVIYDGDVTYIFFHPLLIDDKSAFDKKNPYRKKLFNLFLTPDEFKEVIKQLYRNDYIIVDISMVYKEVYKHGKFMVQRENFKIPKGKKPCVIFIDDLNYNHYMENVTPTKLILDEEDNKIKSIEFRDGKEIVHENKEVISILNDFIEENPEFSLNNARGVIALTGSEGVFGYNTGKNVRKDVENKEIIRRLSKEIFDARKVAIKLKEDGWKFACHTYEHVNLKNVGIVDVKNDLEDWFKYVSAIVGNTNIFVYPKGKSINKDDERFKYINSNGFNIFCGMDDIYKNRDATICEYVDIGRDLICYEKIKTSRKEIYSLLKYIINNRSTNKFSFF